MRQTTDAPSPSTQPLQALCERVGRETPCLQQVFRCAEHPHLSLEVRGTSNFGIHIAFSSEVELSTYIQVVGRGRTSA
jgi:hypothetical protein